MKHRPLTAIAAAAAAAALAGNSSAQLTNYWPLNETSGGTAANQVAAGAAGLLNGGDWIADDTRGPVLYLDGGSYVEAGTLPEFAPDESFTWSFWANSDQDPNNNVIIGNRYPLDPEEPNPFWVKFTTNSFEFRNLDASLNATIDYPNFAVGEWVHHAVVKQGTPLGSMFTYYRNGLAMGYSVYTDYLPEIPFYFGGDQFQENWAGMLDDVATWSSALPPESIVGLATGAYSPADAPLTAPAPPTLATVFSDDFSGTLDGWTATHRGLESTGESTYDPPAIVNGELVLGGTASAQYWLGSSVESVQTFDSRIYTEIEVKRVALDGSGTAWRSSLWVFGDEGHFLHFSQNAGENGWQYNANDVGGSGIRAINGSGNNLLSLDDLDGDAETHTMGIRIIPLEGEGRVMMEMLVDGVPHAVHGFSAFPATFKVVLTGQARATGDFVSATFDDVVVRRETVANVAPFFSQANAPLVVAEGGALSFDAAPLASDPDEQALTFSKADGPDWLQVSAAGQVSGTPPAASAGYTTASVKVEDPLGAFATLELRLRIEPSSLPTPALFGWWPLRDGSGSVARDAGPSGIDGEIRNVDTGGLNDDGSAWAEDPEYGTVLSFNGDNDDGANPGSYVVLGSPPDSGNLPLFSLNNGFAWSFWAKPEQAPTTEILLGNRYDAFGGEFDPREFVKFTGLSFEWHNNALPQDVDYPDLPSSVWMYHVAVKEGDNLYYYRDGRFLNGRKITDVPLNELPFFIAGQGIENWRGYMVDVRVFTGSLSSQEIQAMYTAGPQDPDIPEPGASDFAISSVERGPDGSLTVTFPSEAGQQFTAQFSTTLATWQTVGAVITATGNTTSFTLPAGGTPDPAATDIGWIRIVRQ